MHITNGKIVRFSQLVSNPVHGPWATYEREVRFPEGLTPDIADEMQGRHSGESFSIPVTHFTKTETDPTLVFKVPRQRLNETPKKLVPGMVFQAKFAQSVYTGIITKVLDDYVLLDCNHPASGQKNVSLFIQILDIREQKTEEENQQFTSTIKIL